MIETNGKIKNIIGRQARNGSHYWLVILEENPEILFAWDRDLVDKVYVGDNVKVSYRESRFPKILTLNLEKRLHN